MRCIIVSCDTDMHLLQEFGGPSSHRFPKNVVRNQRWKEALFRAGSNYIAAGNARICSRHFKSSDFREINGKWKLIKEAVPSMHLLEGDENLEPTTASSNNEARCVSSTVSAHGSRVTGGPRNPFTNINSGNNMVVPARPARDDNLKPMMSSSKSEAHSVPTTASDRGSRGSRIPFETINSGSINLLPALSAGGATDGGTKAKRIRYAGDIKDVASMSPEDAKQALPKVLSQLHETQKRANRLKQQNLLLRKNAGSFSSIMDQLKTNKLISAKGELLLQKYDSDSELLKELNSTHRGVPYSEVLRSFATTLNFYSAKAYRFVRASFNNTLPHEKTVARWYRSIDGEPGVTADSLIVLESKCKEMADQGRQLLVSLTMDEVAIQQLVEWNPHKAKFDGVVDYGDSLSFLCDNDKLTAVKEALVFMVTSVDEDWKIPVAYFFICGLKASDKKQIVESVLVALDAVGVKVVGFTFDGTATNLSVTNLLGCNLKINDKPLVTYFQHPSGTHRVYVLLDACHMLKLIRNIFSSQSVLRTMNGEARWEFIQKLNEFQNLTGLKLASKLSDHHVNFQNQKMKVVLATQTFSNSVGEALKSLKSHDPAFEGSKATIELIKIVNDVFDILNSMDSQADGLKKPLCKDNFEEIEQVFSDAATFIRSIQLLTGQSVVQSQYKTGFLGFLIDMQSFHDMYKELVVEQGVLECIRTYRFSQDHVETFFAAVRAKGGSNNNPSASQFKATYKRLLTHNNVTAPKKSNSQDFGETSILSVTTKCLKNEELAGTSAIIEDLENVEVLLTNGIQEDDDFIDDSIKDSAVQQTVAFIRKELVRTLKCKDCLDIIKYDDSCNNFIHTVCEVSEQQFKLLVNDQTNLNIGKYYKLLIKTTVQKLVDSYIWIDFDKHTFENNDIADDHKNNFIKFVVEMFMNMRINRYSKGIQPFKESTRSKYTKLILFEGH